MPNLVPRLPVWNYTTADEVGWERDDWPAVKQLGNISRLTENGWEVAAADNPLLTRPEQAPAVPGPPTTHPASILPSLTLPLSPSNDMHTPGLTVPTTATVAGTQSAAATQGSSSAQSNPSTTTAPTSEAASAEPPASPLWIDRDGTRYFNGIDAL